VIFSKANFGTFSTSVAIQACGAGTGILTARLLGPVARGELATVILWPVILSNLGLMGCNWALVREVAKDPKRECDWAAVGVAVGLASAALYFLAGYFLLPLLLPSGRGYLLPVARLCLLLIPLDISSQVLLAVEHGRMRWRRYNLLRFSFFSCYLVLIGFLGVTRRVQVRWFVLAFLTSHLFTVLLRIWILRKSLGAGNLRFGGCRHLLRAGVPYFGATISNLVSLQLDTILVVSLLSTEAAGIYVVAGPWPTGNLPSARPWGSLHLPFFRRKKTQGARRKLLLKHFANPHCFPTAQGWFLLASFHSSSCRFLDSISRGPSALPWF